MKISCDCKDTLSLDEITEFQGGLKARSPEEVGKIIKSLKKYGFAFPFFIWKESGKNWCLDGHGRLLSLKKMRQDGEKIPPLPVVYVKAKDEGEARNLLLRLNSQYGRMTADSVREFANGFDVDFTELQLPCGMIDFEIADVQETEGDDDVPDVDEKQEPDSQPGVMYELGNSILMCGDSTSEDDVKKLMDGKRADICFTSPPYNMQASDIKRIFKSKKVKDSYGIKDGTYDEFTDDLDDGKYEELLVKALGNALSCCDDVLFNIGILKGSKSGIIGMLSMFRDNFSDVIVWNKSSCMPLCLPSQKSLVNHICELIFCFNKDGDRSFSHSQWKLGAMTNRIDTAKQNANEFSKEHHATFPVELPEYVIKNFTEKSVLDLFGGTGTTLIAAEKLGRSARLMELSPRYCDIIRRRYTKWAKENNRPITSGCLE